MLTETQKNGQRTKTAVKRWSKLLECNKGFTPITNKHVRNTTGVLLENQWRWINEAATNSSVFGGNHPVSGGALSTGDNYAKGDNRLPRVLLPMVRRIYPALAANEMVGVQPMMGPVGLAFALRYKYLKGPNALGDSAVNHVHDAGHGTDGVVKPHGIKGIETTASFTVTKAAEEVTLPSGEKQKIGKGTLILIENYNGIPQPQECSFVELQGGTAEAPTYTAMVLPYGYSIPLNGNTVSSTGAAKVVGVHGEGSIKPGEVTDGHVYTGNDEMGFQRIETRFTGRQDARLTQPLAGGRWQFRPEDTGIAAQVAQFEGTGAVARTSFGFEKCSVEAGTRRLSTSWTLETEEDLKNTNGIDIDTEATQQMSYELQAEIDREMVVRMLFCALSNKEWSVWTGALADARWLGERARALYQHILKMSIRMRVRNRRGAANFLLVTPDVASVLQSLEEFVDMPAAADINTSNMASAAAGTLGGSRFKVFIDDRTPVYDGTDYGYGYDHLFDPAGQGFKMPNYIMLGYKGAQPEDCGIVYCPYIPIMVQTAIDPYSWEPQVGLSTRYGVQDNIFGSHLYYHVVIVDSFSQPGISEKYSHLYPAGYVGAPDASVQLNNQWAFPVQGDVTINS